MRRALLLSVLAALGACGDDGGSSGTPDASIDGPTTDAGVDAAIDAPAGVLALTSPTITEGGAIPLTHVCTARGGMNQSPALAFAGVPAGTMSFAVVLTDTSNGLVHSAIYDIPATLTGLPADVDTGYAPADVAGAHQTNNYSNQRRYAGPCPNTMHTYQFKLYAVGTATAPGTMMNTNKDQLVTILAANNLGTATLTATFTP